MQGPTTSNRSRFFVAMTALMLMVTLIGFARTFYLSVFFDFPDLPVYLRVHGLILTTWFTLAFAQTYLVATNRTRIHRRLGVVGAFVAVGVVAVSVLTVVLRDAPSIDEDAGRAFGNLSTVIAFALCVTFAILLRHQPAAHKRLMLFASISVIAPALDRLARLSPLNEFSEMTLAWVPLPPEVAFASVATLALVLAVLIHDPISERRLRLPTVMGALCLLVVAPGISFAFTSSGAWPALVRLIAAS